MKKKTYSQKYIHSDLIIIINKLKKELQIEQNIKKGRFAKNITFIDASKYLVKRFKR